MRPPLPSTRPLAADVEHEVGALLAPGPPKMALEGTSFDPDGIRRSPQHQLSTAAGKLPPEQMTRLRGIADLEEKFGDSPPALPQAS